jgi:2-polyprenyl-6-hydroxyphenyl methylase/3-demethylubiquinone-9 3-methyltransferase
MNVSETNNSCYDELGPRWYSAKDDPIALLRAESRLRLPWILELLASLEPAQSGESRLRVLDVGCGAGFLSNELAKARYRVVGIDASRESLKVAEKFDETSSVLYQTMRAEALEFPDQSFDVVCAMDFLEHTPRLAEVIGEISRVLKPGGKFIFHTFNRNILSKLVIIKGVEWFVRNTPKDLHVGELFIKPDELRAVCALNSLSILEFRGVAPRVFSRAFWKMLSTGRVPDDFEFIFTRRLWTGYAGVAQKI